jgi:hypothetical protein
MFDQQYLASDLSVAELINFHEMASPEVDIHEEYAVSDADFALALALQEEVYAE